MGAMRFFPFMAMVTNLLKYFGIPTDTFPGNTMRQLYLRGVEIQLDNQGNALNSPYLLAPSEPQNYFQLIMNVLNQAVPNATQLNAQQWRDVTRNAMFKGRELWRWGMQNVCEEVISSQAFSFIYDAVGLDSMFVTTNAAMSARMIAQPLPDYEQGKVLRPVNGFGSLVEELERRLAACPNFEIFKGHRLAAAHRSTEGFLLDFSSGIGPIPQVAASKVVFAMPKRAVELIDLDDLFHPAERDSQRRKLHRKLGTVVGVPAFKIAMVYEKPWWQSFTNSAGVSQGWTNGYSVTDLPIRQVFFGVGQGPEASGNERVLLATYADSDAALYWEGISNVSNHLPRLGANFNVQQAGPGNLLNALQRQLTELTQISTPLPQPQWVGYMDWEDDPYGGAWHEWKPGVEITTAIPDLRQPIPGLPLYLCGEAYSWFQAWIEGALMSAERLVQDHFGLKSPSEWLPGDYDLGP
jgi:monoamine oxidase